MNLVFRLFILDELISKHQVERYEVEEVVENPRLLICKHTKG